MLFIPGEGLLHALGLAVLAGALFATSLLVCVLCIIVLRGRTGQGRSGSDESLSIGFVHPDLGIGGAERLVVDAAVGLQNKGYSVIMYTSHHDPGHAFKETTDGTLRVKVYGDFLPRSVFGRMHILCASARGLYLALMLGLHEPRADLFIVDQLATPIPVLFLTGSRILFYCHFPDLKLSGVRSLLKGLYRLPFDFLEEKTTLLAHRILVNSRYTAQVFQETFRSAVETPTVLYPAINLATFDVPVKQGAGQGVSPTLATVLANHTCLVSINRFERKKDVGLALRSFALLRNQLPPADFSDLRLVLAGGYDPRVRENIEYREELGVLASDLGVGEQVIFKESFSETERSELLSHGLAVVYTPVNEHFGIVPLEAMYARRPVIACNSGGPTESIVHGETGFLCAPEPLAFATAMRRLLQDRAAAAKMGEAGRTRVREMFSLESFSTRLDAIVRLTVAAAH